MLWWNFEIIYMDCLKNLFGKMEDGGGGGIMKLMYIIV